MLTARDEPKAASPGSNSAPTTMCPSRSSRASCRCASPTSSGARKPAARAAGRDRVRFGAVRVSSRRAASCAAATRSIRLTDREREMLRVLAAAPGETVPRMALAGNGGSRQRARRRRAGQPAAPQDRARSGQSADRADRARHRLPAGGRRHDHARPRHGARCARRPSRVSDGWGRFNALAQGMMPKGLYARALLIIIAPMVILQSVVAFVFMERHWNLVTRHLSAAVVQRHRGADRDLQDLSAGRRPRAAPQASRRTAGPRRRFPAAVRHAAAGTEAVLLAARPGAVGGDSQADRPAVLDRHRRPLRRWSKSASSSTTR